MYSYSPCSQPCSRPPHPPETPGYSWANLGQSLVGSLLLSHGSSCTQCFVCALRESVSPFLCKFWRFYGGVNGNLLQDSLCHTQISCTRAPCPCGSPLLTHTSARNTQTQSWLSLCGVSGSWCAQGLFEHSECLWRLWVLILNVISPLLPSCWGSSFALRHGISFLGGIQHSPLDGCSAVSCNFSVLTGEDECTSFYSTILIAQ